MNWTRPLLSLLIVAAAVACRGATVPGITPSAAGVANSSVSPTGPLDAAPPPSDSGDPFRPPLVTVTQDELDRASGRLETYTPPPEQHTVSAATSAPEARVAAPRVEPVRVDGNYAVVRTFFGTNRSYLEVPGIDEPFGADRSEVRYGTCDVSIPRDHRMGAIEAPSVWRLEFSEDPEKHVVVLDRVVRTKDEFFAAVAQKVGSAPSKSAFVFVHGYNVSFDDAARRTAQISYDLGFEGAATFFSWPSAATTAAYSLDEQAVEWAQSDVKAFLDDFLTRSTAERVYVIAHSMGNRAVTRAMAALLTEKPALRPRLTELVLAAPDIDADVFRRDIAPALASSGRPITLYASADDVALDASRQVHGFPRAGDAGASLVVVPGIETIDATGMDASLLKHSYFADLRTVLGDLYQLIRDGKRADQRPALEKRVNKGFTHWVFREVQASPNPGVR